MRVTSIEIHYCNEVGRSTCVENTHHLSLSFDLPDGNGLDFFQADPLTAQYLQSASPSPGLPIGVSRLLHSGQTSSNRLFSLQTSLLTSPYGNGYHGH